MGLTPVERALDRHRKWNVFLVTTMVSAAAAFAFFWWRGKHGGGNPIGLAMNDSDLKAEVVAELVRTGQGIFDSHVDPVVGRVLQPGLRKREFQRVPIDTNWYGLREKAWQVPKPTGVVRVALLGDSFVFAEGAEADARASFVLERLLESSSGRKEWSIEVLAIAVPSWNIEAECQWLRRALDVVDPDLVIQVSCSNDLDDMEGVRGFGSRSRAAIAHPERCDGRLTNAHPIWYLEGKSVNRLAAGLDWESERAFANARDAIAELAAALDARAIPYAHVYHWAQWNGIAKAHLQGELPDERQLALPDAFYTDKSLWVRADDPHWGERGGERVAEILFTAIRAQNLLPELTLRAEPELEQRASATLELGRANLSRQSDPEALAAWQPIGSALDTRAWSEETRTLVHGGIDREGYVSPYASVLLRNVRDGRVRVTGSSLGASALAGAKVTVLADALELGVIELAPGAPIDVQFALPEALASRRYLSLRFESSDWVYIGAELQHSVVFQLHTLAIATEFAPASAPATPQPAESAPSSAQH